jgi:hypothetical protein
VRRWRGLVLGLLLSPLVALPARAQLSASLAAGAGRERLDAETGAAALFITPGIALRSSDLSLDLRGRLARFAGGEFTGEALGTAGWQVVGDGRTGLRLGVDAEGSWYDRGTRNGLVLGTARFAIGDDAAGAWLGGGIGGADAGWGFDPLRALEVGGRVNVRGVTVGLNAGQRWFQRNVTSIRDSVVFLPPDTLVPVGRFEVTRSRPHSYMDGELTVGWSSGRLAAELVVGGRVGNSRIQADTWARIDAQIGLAPGLLALFSAGRTPAVPERGLSGQPQLLLGLNLTLPAGRRAAPQPTRRPPGVQVTTGRSGARVIRIPIADAQRVELIGDFTDWRPLEMTQIGSGLWEIELHIEPGVYRVNIRIDGGPLMVPPGLTPVSDEFNGSVGELVID